MPKAISMVTFIDRDDNDKVYQLKVTINNDFSVESEYIGKALPQLTEPPKKEPKPTLGDKVEGIIDGLTGGKLKKCGGCARRKAMLDKLGGSNEQVTETSRDAN
jgi:hypothetical protein